MGTRAATFSAKIRNIHDYCMRIQHGILPQPTETDISNTLKHFSQTLLGVLKDVPTISMDTMRSREKDHARMSLIPNMNYKGLYTALVQLLDAVPMMQQGLHGLGHSIIYTLICLVPFLEHEYMDTLPYLVASSMSFFPETLHKYIVDVLCTHLLPFTVSKTKDLDNQNYATLSTSAILMMTFQYTKNNACHCQMMECLMSLKRDVLKDLFCVIAHGTPDSRAPAANLLFYYWPGLNPPSTDRRIASQIKHTVWEIIQCQRKNCVNPSKNQAVKMCLDHPVVIGPGDLNPPPPPLFICQECSCYVVQEYSPEYLLDFLYPVENMSHLCQNKNCRSTDKVAVCTCFALECASFNGNRPIRYCSQCNNIRHNSRRGADHVVHAQVPVPWNVDCEMQSYMIEAIISLLKEAQPVSEKIFCEGAEKNAFSDEDDDSNLQKLEERRLLSRYGIWLMVGLCSPTEDTPIETLGRLLAMLFEWFYSTACLIDDRAGDTLEKLKTENIQGWLRTVCETHFEVFVSCLFPYPVHYARVGDHWGNHMSQAESLKEGFKRLLCLVPYDIITVEVWNYIMPYWMEAVRTEIYENELADFQVLFSKVFDVDMSPLGFTAAQIYQFISEKFSDESTSSHEKALLWIQILTQLEVFIPLDLLFSMYQISVTTVSRMNAVGNINNGGKVQLTTEDGKLITAECDAESDTNLPCFVLMLDILLKQIELQEIPSHSGLETPEAKDALNLVRDLIKASWIGSHTCELKSKALQCECCELGSVFYQICVGLFEYLCPIMETTVQDVPDEEVDDTPEKATPDEADKEKQEGISMKELEERLKRTEMATEESDLTKNDSSDGNVTKIMTALEVVEPDSLDTVAMIPTEEVVTAFARAVTLTETDVALAKCTVASATLVDENDQTVLKEQEDDSNFWHTTQGKFKYTIEELPPHLQLIHSMLRNMNNYNDPDITFYLLSCLRLMCLHAEVLSKAARDHRGFLIWTQENLLIPNLWRALSSDYSHIAQIASSLLLHSLTLPSGADTFCKILEENFHSQNWQTRFSAVEKVTMVSRFLEAVLVKSCQSVQSSVATAFVYLIRSLDDINVMVSQRAHLYLETVKASSIKLLCGSLEAQFDTVIVDRPMILQTIYQLYVTLDSVKFLNWDFFLNRFDALFLEAQIGLEKSGDIAYPRDLKNTNMNSEAFIRKLSRAHEALSTVTDNHRTLSASFGTKWPYKRALSAPAGMVARTDKLDKEKIYNRQSSAPLLKRKSSRFSGGFHFPNHIFPVDGNLKEQKEDEMLFLFLLPKIMELEDNDKETMHMLTFLLMQFLSRPDHAYPTDEKAMAKIQNIVLKHFSALLGYCASERGFFLPPSRLRTSPVFNACISSLPKILDQNLAIGNQMMSTWLPLLIYCPSPLRFSHEYQKTNYSLWLLEPHVRISWLMTVLVMLYKYRYNGSQMSKSVQTLIHIVLNTLDNQNHTCKNKFDTFILGSSYISQSRELSSVSIDMETGPSPSHTPPPCVIDNNSKLKSVNTNDGNQINQPKVSKDNSEQSEAKEDIGFVLGNNLDFSKPLRDKYERQQWKNRKYSDYNYSSDVDDIEPELEAIPESPKSESSTHDNSLLGSIADLPDLQTTITIETARVRVERPSSSSDEEGLLIVNPSAEVVEQPTVVIDPTAKVECHMEHQLQAFERSWISSGSESSNGTQNEDDRLQDVVIHGYSDYYGTSCTKRGSVSDQGNSSIICIGNNTQSDKNSTKILEQALHGHMTKHNDPKDRPDLNRAVLVEPRMISAEPHGPVTELQEIKVIKHDYLEEFSQNDSKLVNRVEEVANRSRAKTQKKLEILDPSHLEESIKNEPTVVKQVEHIASSTNSSGILSQKFSMKTYEIPSSSYQINPPIQKDSKPYTIKLESSFKSESVQTMPSQERLLPVGLSQNKREIKLHKDSSNNTVPNMTDVATQASDGIKSSYGAFDSGSRNIPPVTSAIVRHSVNPTLQTITSLDSKDSTSKSLQYPSQERLLPVGMSPKSRGSPATPTRKWKMMVHEIDIGEKNKNKISGFFEAETQMIYPPIKMEAQLRYVDADSTQKKADRHESGVIKADTRIYEGPKKIEPKIQTIPEVMNSKAVKKWEEQQSYKVFEPHHHFLQKSQHSTEISRQDFTKSLQSKLVELHLQQDKSERVEKFVEPEIFDGSNILSETVAENKQNVTIEASFTNPCKNARSYKINEPISRNEIRQESSMVDCVKANKISILSNVQEYEIIPESCSVRPMDCFELSPVVQKCEVMHERLKQDDHQIILEPTIVDAQTVSLEVKPEEPIQLKPLTQILQPIESIISEEVVDHCAESSGEEVPCDDMPSKNLYKQRKQRKPGISSFESQKSVESRKAQKQFENSNRSYGPLGSGGGGAPSKRSSTTQISGSMKSEDIISERCMECGCILEQYNDEEIGLCIVILEAFINREPGIAAPLLPDIFKTVAKIGACYSYPWQSDGNIHLPGGASSTAKQFMRCILHQLAPNGIFTQIFSTSFEDHKFFKTVATSLADFNDLNQMAPLILLLENLNMEKVLPIQKIPQMLENMAVYLEYLPLESCGSIWCTLLPQFDTFLRKLVLNLPQTIDITDTLKIIASLLKVSAINSCKSILDPFSKLLSATIQNHTFKFQYLLDICHLCNRTFNRERDKLLLTRTVIFELVQALKFKTIIPDHNLLMLVQFVLQDAGGSLSQSIITGELLNSQNNVQNMINTNASDCMRANLTDALDFVADVHTLSKLQTNFHRTAVSLNEETLGSQLKAGIAQYIALDITKGNNRDNRALSRYLPWLFNPPSSLQQGPKEFTDCVAHIRLLSWLLLGALMHSSISLSNNTIQCQPISLEVNQHVADHIQVILTGFAEQSKASVLHMSSLFHAFILCQLWTMYNEHLASINPANSEQSQTATLTLTDFWTKVTPGILQLVSHSKVLAEMVNLHFLSLMEALLECNSTILAKLLPMWTPVLYSCEGQLQSHLQVRLIAVINQKPVTQTQEGTSHLNSAFLKWLKKLQFKLGQIELQSSAAIQFYSV